MGEDVTERGVREYADAIREEYQNASRSKKSEMLDRFCEVTEYHRKSAIRLLNSSPSSAANRGGRPRVYGPELMQPLVAVWEASDMSCGKRLAPIMGMMLDAMQRHGEINVSEQQREKLEAMSASTIDRRLRKERQRRARMPMNHKKSSSSIQSNVPVRMFGDWDEPSPGEVQADLVSHCGGSVSGAYVRTLVTIDVATGWTTLQPIAGRRKEQVQGALHKSRRRFPVELLHLHTDNGGEFLNHTLVPYCHREGIEMSRGRPYRKNDQAYVEQRIGRVVRQWIGYRRLSSQGTLEILRGIYRQLESYINHFSSMRKVVARWREGAKIRRRFDTAQTPLQRMLANEQTPQNVKNDLRSEHLSLNPVTLRRKIQREIAGLHELARNEQDQQR